MALTRIWIPSPCYNGRNIGGVRLIVLHTAEGARTIEDLGHFFQNYNNQVSSHVGADDKLGKIGEYVTRGNSAWTAANYNPVAVQLELCGFASWNTTTWKNQHHNMLQNCADWIAEESKKLGIPITKLTAGQAQGNGRGVCQHRDLGAGGGGHSDCGNGFPMDYVLDLARGNITSEPQTEDEDEMFYLVMAEFKPGNFRTSFPIANQYAGGKHKLTFTCLTEIEIEVDNVNSGKTETRTLGRANKGETVNIIDGNFMIEVRTRAPSEPIGCTISVR